MLQLIKLEPITESILLRDSLIDTLLEQSCRFQQLGSLRSLMLIAQLNKKIYLRWLSQPIQRSLRPTYKVIWPHT